MDDNPGKLTCPSFKLLSDNLGNGFNDAISAAGPNTGSCVLWEHAGCTGRSITVRNPGIPNLADVGFNDIASSYRCTN